MFQLTPFRDVYFCTVMQFSALVVHFWSKKVFNYCNRETICESNFCRICYVCTVYLDVLLQYGYLYVLDCDTCIVHLMCC